MKNCFSIDNIDTLGGQFIQGDGRRISGSFNQEKDQRTPSSNLTDYQEAGHGSGIGNSLMTRDYLRSYQLPKDALTQPVENEATDEIIRFLKCLLKTHTRLHSHILPIIGNAMIAKFGIQADSLRLPDSRFQHAFLKTQLPCPFL